MKRKMMSEDDVTAIVTHGGMVNQLYGVFILYLLYAL